MQAQACRVETQGQRKPQTKQKERYVASERESIRDQLSRSQAETQAPIQPQRKIAFTLKTTPQDIIFLFCKITIHLQTRNTLQNFISLKLEHFLYDKPPFSCA